MMVDRGGRHFTGYLLQVAHALGHRFEQFAVQIVAAGDERAEIGRFERAHPRGLERAHARDGRRGKQQRHFAEVIARAIASEHSGNAVELLEHLDLALEQHEERGDLALADQPVAHAQADVGAVPGKGLEFGVGQ